MIKKFHAANTRDALRLVRDALGANAIILSNRQVSGGVEIIAVADMDMASLTSQAEPMNLGSRHAPRPTPPPPTPSLDDLGPQLTLLADYVAQKGGEARQAEPTATSLRPSPARQPAPPGPAVQPGPPIAAFAPPPPAAELPAGAMLPSAAVEGLAEEVRLLRGLVEGQLAGFAWNDLTRHDGTRAELMRRLLAAGFSAAFSRQLLERLPASESELTRALKWIKSTIAANLKIAPPEQDIIERGGIYALVGPTGVGKTTTVAKLAARAVLRHGAGKVALITTDTYRIGAQDQLRIYGRILGTPVFAVRDENDLELTLADLPERHVVLIDTVGMSQRDKRVAEQVALLSGEGRSVKRLLLLGAPNQGVTLDEVARAYAGPGLIGCVLTKIDEAQTFGPVLDVAIRHELPVHFVTNGQRVPEDLHLANATYLADRAFRSQLAEPFHQDEADFPILMAAQQVVKEHKEGAGAAL
jgi:flagellar biosynthesis protein FlhF